MRNSNSTRSNRIKVFHNPKRGQLRGRLKTLKRHLKTTRQVSKKVEVLTDYIVLPVFLSFKIVVVSTF
ncbi:hypothetical protein LEP1GSC101_3816 [Leptospira borgpetersenii str. UI 09149]|nr:hypothetical protein LEP1GSC101_3816 [Leptospira borgpetersenii str. UI 09149]